MFSYLQNHEEMIAGGWIEVSKDHSTSYYPPDNHHAGAWAIIKVKGPQYQWLAGGCYLEIGLF